MRKENKLDFTKCGVQLFVSNPVGNLPAVLLSSFYLIHRRIRHLKQSGKFFISCGIEHGANTHRRLKIAAYEDMKDGLLTKEDYQDITAQYEARISKELLAKEQIHREMDLYLQNEAFPQQWIQEFLAYHNVQTLTRIMAAQCIESIVIYEGKRIELTFRHMQDYQALVSQVQDYHQQIQEGAG